MTEKVETEVPESIEGRGKSVGFSGGGLEDKLKVPENEICLPNIGGNIRLSDKSKLKPKSLNPVFALSLVLLPRGRSFGLGLEDNLGLNVGGSFGLNVDIDSS